MKKYTMLQTVQGSRDGIKVETFHKGETYELDAALAEQFYHQGAVKEAGGATQRDGAGGRSAKVTGPAETKVTGPTEANDGEAGVPLATQNIEELVTLARDTYGLDVDSTMDEATLRAMIEQAACDEEADLSKMTKKQLVAFAKDNLGLELDETAKKDDLLAAIEAHADA